jgi:hypothetical protein
MFTSLMVVHFCTCVCTCVCASVRGYVRGAVHGSGDVEVKPSTRSKPVAAGDDSVPKFPLLEMIVIMLISGCDDLAYFQIFPYLGACFPASVCCPHGRYATLSDRASVPCPATCLSYCRQISRVLEANR